MFVLPPHIGHILISNLKRKHNGFSLIELLIGLSCVVAIGAGAVFASHHISNMGKISACNSKISSLMLKVRTEYAAYKKFPENLLELKGETIESLTDPWGTTYEYVTGKDYFCIVSGGPNKSVETNTSSSFDSSKQLSGDDLGMCFVVEE